MDQVPWLNPTTHAHRHREAHTPIKRDTHTHTHFVSPRVNSTAVPVGSLRDLDHQGQNKVYTNVGALRKISMKTNVRYLTKYIPVT